MNFWRIDWGAGETKKEEFVVKIYLPKQIQRELKIRCANKGLSQRAYLTELILRALSKDTKK